MEELVPGGLTLQEPGEGASRSLGPIKCQFWSKASVDVGMSPVPDRGAHSLTHHVRSGDTLALTERGRG